jgi:hydrogenase nickel incorporation protein HypA/HybF
MHELRIAEDLAEIILETAISNKLSKVNRVNIVFGKLIQIVPEIFEYAFMEAVRCSVASETDLNIEIAPVKLRCRSCETCYYPGDNLFVCSNCQSSDCDIINGKELFVKSIEGE